VEKRKVAYRVLANGRWGQAQMMALAVPVIVKQPVNGRYRAERIIFDAKRQNRSTYLAEAANQSHPVGDVIRQLASPA